MDSSPEETPDYYSDFNYTIINCLRSCVQERIIANCSCADPRYEKPENTTDCTVYKIPCLREMIKKDSQTAGPGSFSPVNDCGCKPACEDSIVDIVISLGNFPSNAYTVLNGPDADLVSVCLSHSIWLKCFRISIPLTAGRHLICPGSLIICDTTVPTSELRSSQR